jgi:hypothetical protein
MSSYPEQVWDSPDMSSYPCSYRSLFAIVSSHSVSHPQFAATSPTILALSRRLALTMCLVHDPRQVPRIILHESALSTTLIIGKLTGKWSGKKGSLLDQKVLYYSPDVRRAKPYKGGRGTWSEEPYFSLRASNLTKWVRRLPASYLWAIIWDALLRI